MQKKLKRRILRLERQIKELSDKHHNKEKELTYYGGWDLGYLEGKLAALESLLDNN